LDADERGFSRIKAISSWSASIRFYPCSSAWSASNAVALRSEPMRCQINSAHAPPPNWLLRNGAS